MKTGIFSKLVICMLLASFTGCNFLGTYERGNGDVITTNRSLPSFSKISIEGNFEVILEKSKDEGISITSDKNLEPLIKTTVRGDELVISTDKKLISARKTSLIVHYNKLSEIGISGATLLKNEEELESGDLHLDLSGAGVIDLQIKTNELEAHLSGAGLVKLKGYASSSSIDMSGAGGLDAYGLETEDCQIDVSGIGGAKINVKNSLSANITGVGGIQYIGNPSKIDKNISGIGSIKAGDENSDTTGRQ
jgi:hypothetical protein